MKIGRLREHGQHCLNHWSLFEIAGLARDLCYGRQRVVPFYHGLSHVSKNWNNQILQVESRQPIRSLNPASKEMTSDSAELCETENLFLTHPTYRNKCMTSKNAQLSSRSGFWVLRSPAISESWNSPGLHCLGSITHITILFVFTCVMNVRYQSIQAFVTGFGPFCNRSRKFVHWP